MATNQNLAKGKIFFLVIYDEDGDADFSSHYFNLTQKKASSTTQQPFSTMDTSISSGPATTEKASSTVATATSSPSSSTDSGLSTGAKVGLGVGIPVAVILAGAAGAGWFISQRKRRQAAPPKGVDAVPMYQEQKQPLSPQMLVEAPPDNERHELPATTSRPP